MEPVPIKRLHPNGGGKWPQDSIREACANVKTNDEATQLYKLFLEATQDTWAARNGVNESAVLRGLAVVPNEVAEVVLDNMYEAPMTALCERFDVLSMPIQQRILKMRTGAAGIVIAGAGFLGEQNPKILERYQYSRTPKIRMAFALNETVEKKRRLSALLGRDKNGKPIAQLGVSPDSHELQLFVAALETKEQKILTGSLFTSVQMQILRTNAGRNPENIARLALSVAELFEVVDAKYKAGHHTVANTLSEHTVSVLAQIARTVEEISTVNLQNGPDWGPLRAAMYNVAGFPRKRNMGYNNFENHVSRSWTKDTMQKRAQLLRVAAENLLTPFDEDQLILTGSATYLSNVLENCDALSLQQQQLFLKRLATAAQKERGHARWMRDLLAVAEHDFSLQILKTASFYNLYLYHPNLSTQITATEASKYLPLDFVLFWPQPQIQQWLEYNDVTIVELVRFAQMVDVTADEILVLAQ